MSEDQKKALSLYIHWPYCQKICPYCNFNVYLFKKQVRSDLLLEAFMIDMKNWRELTGSRVLSSIHFGGGTPSLLKIDELDKLLKSANQLWEITEKTEIALEANPSDLNHFQAFSKLGVTRLSLGIQALDNQALKMLGRLHDYKQAIRALNSALTFFPRVSVDMIYARPGQTQKSWEIELSTLFSTEIEHISLYQLTIEAKTALENQVRRNQVIPLKEEISARFYEQTQYLCESAGFQSYEISNHARHDQARSKHNMAYWKNADWAGLGPGAQARLTLNNQRISYETYARPKEYIQAVKRKKTGIVHSEILSPQEWANESLLMGLRLTQEGVSLSKIEKIARTPIKTKVLKQLLNEKWFVVNTISDEHFLRVTEKGRLVLDRLVNEISYEI